MSKLGRAYHNPPPPTTLHNIRPAKLLDHYLRNAWRQYVVGRDFLHALYAGHPLTALFRRAWKCLLAFAQRIIAYLGRVSRHGANAPFVADYRLASLCVLYAASGEWYWGKIPDGENPWNYAFLFSFGKRPGKLIPIWEEYRHRYDTTVPAKPVTRVGRQIGKAAAAGF